MSKAEQGSKIALSDYEAKRSTLKGWIAQKIETFDKKAKKNKTHTIIIKLLSLFCSIATTIVLGIDWGADNTTIAKNTAFILSTAAAAGIMLESFRKPKEHWLRFQGTANELRALRDKVDILMPEKDQNSKHIEKYYGEYHTILSSLNADWSKLQEDDRQIIPQLPSGGAG